MPQERTHRATRSVHATLILIVLGVAAWPRLLGYNAVPLWLDEAWRANLIMDDGWLGRLFEGSTTSAVTSFVYAALVHGLGAAHDTEWVLRLSSLAPGIVAVLLFVPLVNQATGSAMLGYLAALAGATQPMLLSYSKELKPYSFELCLHMLLALMALSYIAALRQDGTRSRWTMGIVISGPLATLSAANLVFLLPGWYLAIFYACYKSLRRIPIMLIVSAVVSALLLLLQYRYLWSHAAKDAGLIEFWKDGFFSGSGSRIGWIVSRLSDTLSASFESSREPPAAMTRALGAVALAGVIGSLSSRKLHIFLLIVSPVLALVAANALRVWPLGPFRVNAFLYGYLIVLVCVGCAVVIEALRMRYRITAHLLSGGLVAVFLAYWVPGLPGVMRRAPELHPADQDVPAALMSLSAALGPQCDQRSLVLINAAASHAVAYYTKHSAKYAPMLATNLGRCAELRPTVEAYLDPNRYEQTLQTELNGQSSAWFLYSHLGESDIAVQKAAVRKFGSIDSERTFAGAGIFRLTAAPK